jgi:membrane protease YdiL (CAAX protease family)
VLRNLFLEYELQNSIVFLLIYVILMAPSLLFVKQTYRRIQNLRAGIKGLVFLPLTVTSLVIFVFFIFGFLAQFPLFNLSWLGYNIAVGPYADQGFSGILPFLPFLVYTFIHVNYFEEYYFRTNPKRVVIWAFLHMVMGVTISVALMLLPLGFFYKYLRDKYGVDYAYALHFSTNITILLISIVSFIVLGNGV